MELPIGTHGYYRISIVTRSGSALLHTNGERAFIITQLQDLLGARLIIGEVPAYRQLASCIDLLAFSIKPSGIELLLFSIDATITKDFAHRIIARLAQHQYQYRPGRYAISPELHATTRLLKGPHDALAESVHIHRLHQDWEFDRYSSIGFFLHDRRGDWMRLWRLTQLYDNEPDVYQGFLMNGIVTGKNPRSSTATPRSPLLAS